MPEMGFDVEPISPVRREDTVTNMNPNTTISSAPGTFMCRDGATVMATMIAMMPPSTHFNERSRSVRTTDASLVPALRKSRKPSLSPCQIIGSDRNTLIMPPAATAPAPM